MISIFKNQTLEVLEQAKAAPGAGLKLAARGELAERF